MSKWNAWEDGPSRTPPDGARMSGPMADWADEEADDLVSGARDGSIGRAETAAALRKARREGMEAAKTVIADLDTELETLRAREGEMRKALYDASDIAEQHAKFCTDEANAGGSRELFERAVGVRYVAHKMIERMVKALTPASPGEGK